MCILDGRPIIKKVIIYHITFAFTYPKHIKTLKYLDIQAFLFTSSAVFYIQ